MPFDPDAYPGEELASHPGFNSRPSAQQRVDAVYAEMTTNGQSAAEAVKREVDLMTEARVRFAKAALYEQLIEGQLFEGDDQITLEVENEMKTYAEQKLRLLLNIEDEANPTQKLSEDEINVLKLFASKLLGRPASIPRPNDPPKVVPIKTGVVPMAQPKAALAAPKRGRGRPPGTGKNQRTEVAPVQPTVFQRPQAPQARKPDPIATRPVPAPSNVPVDKRPTGKVTSQVVDNEQKPLPMPSPDEMIAQAADQGERGLRAQASRMRDPNSHIVNPTIVPG